MKRSKDTGNDNIESKVINKVYDEISCPLFIVFNSSFRATTKIAKGSLGFKTDDIEVLGNYIPISVLSVFS